jgi:2-desacetyl-2-hydroxyethyl bacteriochlorophyllide A dehydrogenase
MQARHLWVTAPNEVSVQEFELADSPGPGQALLEVESSLISAGTELAIVTGTHIGFTTGAAWPRYPMALGYTAVGRVVRLGPGTTRAVVGDRVLAAAPHASHALVDAAQLLPVPSGCSNAEALLGHLASIPLNGVRLAQPQLGEGMVVFGQGLIGALAARLGRLAGCRPVLGVDPIAERRELARQAGIVPVDPREADPASVHAGLAAGRAPEIVVEATGAPAVIPDALRVAGEQGRVVLLGSPRGRVEIDPYTDIHRKGVIVIGAHARTAPTVATASNAFTTERNREVALNLIAEGSLRVADLVSHHVAPEAAAATYRALASREPGYLGVVIDWARV